MTQRETRKFICVSCPVGCMLTVHMEEGRIVNVEGNACMRGEAYAEAEVQNPTRVFASTVKVLGGLLPVVPVRSRSAVPKEKLFDIAREVARIVVEAPVTIGQVVLPDVCGTGVDIVASRSLDAKEKRAS
jgi:CxxC motif-containing protein